MMTGLKIKIYHYNEYNEKKCYIYIHIFLYNHLWVVFENVNHGIHYNSFDLVKDFRSNSR